MYCVPKHIRNVSTIFINIFVMFVLWTITYSLCLFYVHEHICYACTMYIFRIWEIIEEGKMKSITDGVRIGTSMYGAVHFTVQYTLQSIVIPTCIFTLYENKNIKCLGSSLHTFWKQIASKALTFCHKLKFSYPFAFAIWWCIDLRCFKLRLFDLTEYIFWNIKVQFIGMQS